MEEMEERKPKKVSVWLKAFLAFHCLAILSWTLPNPPPGITNGEIQPSPVTVIRHFPDYILAANNWLKIRKWAPHRPYLLSTGLWQYWDMFSPNPSSTDLWLSAVVEYEDGTIEIFPYPRMATLPIHEKYFMERFRKFTERLSPDIYSYKWDAFAMRVAYLSWKDEQNPPARIELVRHWMEVPSMDQPLPKEYQFYAFYELEVPLSALQEMRRK